MNSTIAKRKRKTLNLRRVVFLLTLLVLTLPTILAGRFLLETSFNTLESIGQPIFMFFYNLTYKLTGICISILRIFF